MKRRFLDLDSYVLIYIIDLGLASIARQASHRVIAANSFFPLALLPRLAALQRRPVSLSKSSKSLHRLVFIIVLLLDQDT